jgi:hypothetical protein
MTARIYLEVVLVGLALLALSWVARYTAANARSVLFSLPLAVRYTAANARRALPRPDRTWLPLAGLGAAFVLVSIALTAFHPNREIGALALTEDAKSMGLLCALAFGGGIVLRSSQWVVMSALGWAIAVELSQLWMVRTVGGTAYMTRLHEYIQPSWYRFGAGDIEGIAVVAGAPIALSATAGVLIGRVGWPSGIGRSKASAVPALVVLTVFAGSTLFSVDSSGLIKGETYRDSWLWFLALAMTPVAAAVLGKWRASVTLPLLAIAATLIKPAVAIQARGLAAYQRDLPCGYFFGPCTVAEVVGAPILFALFLTLPLAFVGALIGKVIRQGRTRKRLRAQNAPTSNVYPAQPEPGAGPS